MSHEFQPEETGAQQIGTLTAPPAAPEAETEHDAQTARLVSERLNEIAHYARRIELNFWLSARLIGFSCVFSVAIMSFAASAQDLPTYLMGLVFCIADVVAFHHAVRARSQKMPAFDAAQTARLGGVKAIPALFAALQSPLRANHHTAIHSALKMLLPQIKASDAHFLTPASRRIIHGWLAMRYMEYGITDIHNDWRLIALKALEQVGDAESLPVVERLTKMKAQTPAQRIIKRAAIDCLSTLRANCGEVEAARTLLRASHPQDARPETLLRPASSTDTAPQDLLRGAEKP